jgi:hypothetical protein
VDAVRDGGRPSVPRRLLIGFPVRPKPEDEQHEQDESEDDED